MALKLVIVSESGYATRFSSQPDELRTVLDGSSDTYTATIDIVEPELQNPWTVLSVVKTGGPPGFNMTLSGKTITLSGKASKLFTNQTADFLLKDLKTIVTKPLFDDIDFATIVKWTPPSPTKRDYTYSFNITYSTLIEGVETELSSVVSLNQSVMWDYYVGSAGFREVLAKGIL